MSIQTAANYSADRISSLPDDVRYHVLNFLPLKDAAVSSVLSTEWKNSWNYLPTLVFDEKEIKLSLADIRRVLVRHRGPLREFSLSLSLLQHSKHNGDNLSIDEILQLLPGKTLISLTIDHSRIGLMKTPFSQFKTLRLSDCVLDSTLVPFNRCFDNLTVLELRRVQFRRNSARWKFICPLLTTLTLDRCGCVCFTRPVIVIEEAPKLSSLYLDGDFSSLQFNSSTPLLKEVFIRKTRLTWTVESDLLKVNGGLFAVESLSVARYFYEYMAADRYVECNHKPWEKLRRMRLDNVRLRAKGHARAVLRMINSSPNLQQLTILMDNHYYAVETKNLKDEKALEMMKSGGAAGGSGFEQMKRIEVKGVRGSDDELSLIRWLLNSSPALEEMEIQVCTVFSSHQVSHVVKSVNGFHLASSRARLTYTRLLPVR